MKIVRLIGLLLLISGSVVSVVGVVIAIRTSAFVRTAQQADGHVIANEALRDSDGDLLYYPDYSFATADGRPVTVHSSMGTNPASFEVGDGVTILYDPQYPGEGRIGTFWHLWFVPVCCVSIGIAHLAVSCVLLLWYRRRKAIVPAIS